MSPASIIPGIQHSTLAHACTITDCHLLTNVFVKGAERGERGARVLVGGVRGQRGCHLSIGPSGSRCENRLTTLNWTMIGDGTGGLWVGDGGGVGGVRCTHLLFVLVIWPLSTHPFRDEEPLVLLIETHPRVGRSLRCFHLLHRNVLLVLSPSCFDAGGRHLSS